VLDPLAGDEAAGSHAAVAAIAPATVIVVRTSRMAVRFMVRFPLSPKAGSPAWLAFTG